ncbi:MAG: hypothetical protein ACE5NP_13310 [Anaerolineae bacterium]
MRERRVFLICTHPLLCEAVQLILEREGIELIGTETDQQKALKSIQSLQPDVILVESEGDAPELIEAISRLIQEKTGARLVNLSLNTNEISIYHREHKTVTKTEDLIQAITGP